eukprot:TRINITY_DN31833_c0_g1_i1.p1 TRINITY_DN31833_c0_g1~~TRINITY_DN31833_c0_g1_i1.p1  ORF type:complete len:559 (-),score=136.89 TRINITY_DN31833_c0_g1_i1:34-1641(-)
MMAYQGDHMYVQSYDASADNTWSWQGQQTWGNSYEQLPYDQAQYDYQQGWDYQQQQQQGWGPAADGSQAGQGGQTTWATAAEAQAAQAAAGSMAQQLAAAAASNGQQGGEAEPALTKAASAGQGAWGAATGAAAEQATTEGASPAAASGQQTSPSLDPVAEPYAGAELLTELRLAELKRLIDRDAQALKKTNTADAQADASRQEPEGSAMAAEQDTPRKGSEGAAVARRSPAGAGGALQESGSEAGPSWRGERRKARDKASASPPGLAAPPEQVPQCHLVLVDFDPDSRTYGEMPVRAGEEVAVSYPPVEDWIYAWKRGPMQDQGWLPSQCLGIGVSISDADTTDGEDWEEAQNSAVQRRRGGRGRGGAADGMPAAVSSGSGRRSKGAEKDGQGGGQQKAGHEAEAEAWHHHGNWWSRQRHLKQESAPAAGAQAAKEEAPVEELPRQRPARQLPPAAAAAISAANADKVLVGGGGKCGGRGKGAGAAGGASAAAAGGGGRGAGAGHRERPALSSLLDRLNKPLVAPTKQAADSGK